MHHQAGRLVDAPAGARLRSTHGQRHAPRRGRRGSRAVGRSVDRDALAGAHALRDAAGDGTPSTLHLAAARSAPAGGCARTRGASATSALSSRSPCCAASSDDSRRSARRSGSRRRRPRRSSASGSRAGRIIMNCAPVSRQPLARAMLRSNESPASPGRSRVGALLAALRWPAAARRRRTRPRNWTPEQLYAEAKDEASAGNYDKADQALRAARGPRRRHAAGAAGAARAGLLPTGRPASRRRRCRRSTASSSCTRPARRSTTRSTCKGLVNFNDNLGMLRLAGAPGPVRARPAGLARIVPVVQAARRAVPAVAVHAAMRALRMNYIVNSLAAVRSARGALLLPARRLRGGGQPRAAGGAASSSSRRRSKRRCTSWCRATTRSA